MFEIPFMNRMIIGISLTFICIVVIFLTGVPLKIIPFTVGVFGYQIIDWVIYNIRKGKFKLTLHKPINFVIRIIWAINNILNHKIKKGGK